MSAPRSLQLTWTDLRYDVREALTGKLMGLYGAPSDPEAFEALTEDKQQALLLLVECAQLDFGTLSVECKTSTGCTVLVFHSSPGQ